MNYALFFVGSTIECFAVFMFMFALFRFRLKRKAIIHVLVVALLMGQVSYFTRLNPEIGDMSTFIQLAIYIIALWVLFQVPLFYSVIMNFAGLAIVIIVQGSILLLLTSTWDKTFLEIQKDPMLNPAVMLLTSLVEIAIARTIYLLNWGFDFVPTSRRTNVKIKGTNAVMTSVVSVGIVVAALLAYLFRNDFDGYVIYASIAFTATVPIFLYFALRKDYEDAS